MWVCRRNTTSSDQKLYTFQSVLGTGKNRTADSIVCKMKITIDFMITNRTRFDLDSVPFWISIFSCSPTGTPVFHRTVKLVGIHDQQWYTRWDIVYNYRIKSCNGGYTSLIIRLATNIKWYSTVQQMNAECQTICLALHASSLCNCFLSRISQTVESRIVLLSDSGVFI